MSVSTNQAMVVQLKGACEHLRAAICKVKTSKNDEYKELEQSNLIELLKSVTEEARQGSVDLSEVVRGWSDDFYSCANLLCFERYGLTVLTLFEQEV